ncbi:MAG: ABC transporter permease [Burkholderiaceae bacterium]
MAAIKAWLATLAAMLRDPGVLLLALVAPVLYSFFYPWPYLNQVPTRVPVALVDADHSGLTRQIARYADASPKLALRLVTGDEREAQAAMQRREIEGYAVLPPELKRHVLRGDAVVVPVVGDGAYFLLNKVVLAGLAESVGTVSAGVEIRKLRARGQGAAQAGASRSPIQLQLVPLYNPSEGYGSYVVPAVAVLIVHQTLLIAVALWAGTWFETRPAGRLRDWWPRLAAGATLGLASGAWFFQAAFRLFDYGQAAHPLAQGLLLALLAWAAAALGVALGAVFADRERAMQVLLFSSIPMVFLSGFSWPAEALAPPLRALAALLPTTPAIQGLLRVNQMDATLADVRPQLLHLAVLAGAATALAFAALARRRQVDVKLSR